MRSGFGIVELAVALTLFSFGILALVGAATVAHRSLITAQALEEGTAAVAMVLDSLAHVAEPAAGQREHGNARVSWTVGSDGGAATLEASVHIRDGVRLHHLVFHAVHPGPPAR